MIVVKFGDGYVLVWGNISIMALMGLYSDCIRILRGETFFRRQKNEQLKVS